MNRRDILKAAGLGLGVGAVAGLGGRSVAQAATAGAPGAPVLALSVDGRPAARLSSFQAPSYEVEDVSQALGAAARNGVATGAGAAAGAARMLGAPKLGEASATLGISQAGELLAWVESVWNKQCVEKDTTVRLADQDYNVKRGIDMSGCVLTGLEWPALDRTTPGRALELTTRFSPRAVQFPEVRGKLGEPPPTLEGPLTSAFSLRTRGLDDAAVVRVSLPTLKATLATAPGSGARLPRLAYASIEHASIKIELGAAGYRSAEDLAIRILQDGNCEEGEAQDILIDMKDQSLKKILGTFVATGCCLKRFDWAPKLEGGKEGLATATLEFMVEDFRFKVDHK